MLDCSMRRNERRVSTSQSSPFDKIKGKFSGCDAYLTKPVRREEFQRTVDQYLIQALTNE